MGRKKLDPEVAADLMRTAGLEPLEAYPGANTPWRCQCVRCGTEVTPRYANVYTTGKGCVPCGRWMNRAMDLYVVYSETLNAVKLGITYHQSQRLGKLRRAGFQVVGTIPFAVGNKAFAVEQDILRKVRLLGHEPKLTKEDMGEANGGHTESFDSDTLNPDLLWGIVWRTAAGG